MGATTNGPTGRTTGWVPDEGIRGIPQLLRGSMGINIPLLKKVTVKELN
jgi:hypothetical protein